MNITKKSDKIKTSVVEKIRKGYSFMGEKKKHSNMTTLMGAAFLMATSAIGPGFLTQTSTFTAQYKSIFALVIICTILLDVTTQLNIWSVIGVSGMRGQDIANKSFRGSDTYRVHRLPSAVWHSTSAMSEAALWDSTYCSEYRRRLEPLSRESSES